MFSNFFSRKIGVDIVDVVRFKFASREEPFLQKVYTPQELDYCFSYKDPSTHLAGMFAAKEAVSKALGTEKYPAIRIEIFHEKNGVPKAYSDGKPLRVSVSISHTDTVACAVATG
jgi:holo-[acyl-carrier protein] synthase